jgi:hypothetical protein
VFGGRRQDHLLNPRFRGSFKTFWLEGVAAKVGQSQNPFGLSLSKPHVLQEKIAALRQAQGER